MGEGRERSGGGRKHDRFFCFRSHVFTVGPIAASHLHGAWPSHSPVHSFLLSSYHMLADTHWREPPSWRHMLQGLLAVQQRQGEVGFGFVRVCLVVLLRRAMHDVRSGRADSSADAQGCRATRGEHRHGQRGHS